MNWGAGRRVELFDKRELEKEMRENQKRVEIRSEFHESKVKKREKCRW